MKKKAKNEDVSLLEWMTRNKVSERMLGEMSGLSQPTIWSAKFANSPPVDGRAARKPTLEAALRIWAATGGEVGPWSYFSPAEIEAMCGEKGRP